LISKIQRQVHLITQWFSHPHLRNRSLEITKTLRKNVENPSIDRIHLLQSPFDSQNKSITLSLSYFDSLINFDPDFPLELFYQKLVLVSTNKLGRLLASDAFAYASTNLKGNIALLANADIYFDSSLELLKTSQSDLSLHTIYFLSRYEEEGKEEASLIGTQCGPKFIGSADTIAFIPPLPSGVSKQVPFHLGSWGIENRILWEFEQYGIKGRNPCYDIKSWHIHENGFKLGWMPQVNTDNKSSVAFPDTLISSLRPDYPWDIKRWQEEQEKNEKNNNIEPKE